MSANQYRPRECIENSNNATPEASPQLPYFVQAFAALPTSDISTSPGSQRRSRAAISSEERPEIVFLGRQTAEAVS